MCSRTHGSQEHPAALADATYTSHMALVFQNHCLKLKLNKYFLGIYIVLGFGMVEVSRTWFLPLGKPQCVCGRGGDGNINR